MTEQPDLRALLAELEAAAEQLGVRLSELGEAASNSPHGPVQTARRLIEATPPELRNRLLSVATSGLTATRDVADHLLRQLAAEPPAEAPEELQIAQRRRRVDAVPATWILTSSVANHEATAATGYSVIGIKERNRKRAMDFEPGDLIVLYLTKVMAFAGVIRVTGDLYEDRTKIWPGNPSNPDPYPWRMATEPVIVVEEEHWVPAETLKTELEHVQKWPADYWKLAFQGQLRTIGEADTAILLDRLQAAAGTPA